MEPTIWWVMFAEIKKNHVAPLFLFCFLISVWQLMLLVGCNLNNGNISTERISSNGKLTLSWNNIIGATSYNVYISTTPGAPNAKSYKIQNAANPIEIRDLEIGTTYYFVVIAVNESGEGAKTKEVSHKVVEPESFILFDDFINKPIATEDLTVFFDTNSNRLKSEEIEKLNRVAQIILRRKSYKVILSGYTDSSGEKEYNKMISKSRAAVVKSYLVGRGVKSDNIEISGLGAVNFIASNHTAEGRKMNRRVEITIDASERE
jgi:outer membrane protein OmpA-like peptidoglycan-associated protein